MRGWILSDTCRSARSDSSQIAALVPDLAEIEPRLVAHRFGGLAGEQRLEYLAGLDVLAERQVQPAEQQLRLAFGVRQALELLRSQQARDRIEIIVLIEIEQDVARSADP